MEFRLKTSLSTPEPPSSQSREAVTLEFETAIFYLDKVKSMPDSLKGALETILVVDDNELVLKTVVAVLKQANVLVLSADCGASAIQLAQETERVIDLLLSDVDMPGMSGQTWERP